MSVLRNLIDRATRAEEGMVPVNPSDLGYVQRNDALEQLEDLALNLALLVVDMSEYVRDCCDEHYCSESPVNVFDEAGPCSAHRLLARLAALEARIADAGAPEA